MQREVAAQNSYLASIKSNKEVVYKAPCDMKSPTTKTTTDPKTS